MWTRRQLLSRGSLGLLAMSGAALAVQGDSADRPDALPDGSASRGMVTNDAEKAVERGLAYLAGQRRSGEFGERAYQGNVSVCSPAGLAFMSAGNQPDRGPHGRLVTETLRYVLNQCQVGGPYPGFLCNQRATPHGPMYGHGFGAL